MYGLKTDFIVTYVQTLCLLLKFVRVDEVVKI